MAAGPSRMGMRIDPASGRAGRGMAGCIGMAGPRAGGAGGMLDCMPEKPEPGGCGNCLGCCGCCNGRSCGFPCPFARPGCITSTSSHDHVDGPPPIAGIRGLPGHCIRRGAVGQLVLGGGEGGDSTRRTRRITENTEKESVLRMCEYRGWSKTNLRVGGAGSIRRAAIAKHRRRVRVSGKE